MEVLAERLHASAVPARWLERHAAVVGVALFAATLALVLPMLGAQGIWFDEASTLQNHRLPFDLARDLRADATPPLYAIVVRAWTALFGASLESVRLLSALATAASTVLLFQVGRRFLGARAGLFAALLFATSRLQLFFAHEARPYAVVVLLCIGSFYALLALLERPSRGRALALGLLDAALLYTHYVAVFALVAQAFAVWLHRSTDRRPPRAFVESQMLAGLLFLPFAVYLTTLLPLPMTGWIAAPTPRTFLVELGKLRGDQALLLADCVLLAGALAWSAHAGFRPALLDRRKALALASWALLPLVAAYVASSVEPVFLARYLLYAAPGIFLLLGYVLASTPATAAAQGLVAAALCAWSLWLGAAQPIVRPAWREAAELVHTPSSRGAVTVVLPAHQALPFAYHFAPEIFGDASRLKHELRARGIFGLNRTAELRDARLAGVGELVLVLATANPADEPRATRWLGKQGFTLVERHALHGVAVLRYTSGARAPHPGWNGRPPAG